MRKIATIFLILGLLLLGTFGVYQYEISPVDKKSMATYEVVVKQGMSTSEIANLLKEKNLIRNSFFFKVYMKLNRKQTIKAATYDLKKSMDLDTIVSLLEVGKANDDISITFKEGKTIKDYAKVLSTNTNISEDDFLAKMKDKTYLTSLINSYWFLTDDILNDDIYYGLEGYLAPDTYNFKDKDVSIEEVVKTLLDQEEKNLDPYKNKVNKANIHDILTLASMAELEGVKEKDRKMIVGVFQNRLSKNMNLGSDVTTYYAFSEDMTKDLTSEMFNTYNPYNTRSSQMAGKLPVGPICNPSKSSIEASINPTSSDYYYFVADKNGNVYYTKTSSEHSAKVKELKDKGDWIW